VGSGGIVTTTSLDLANPSATSDPNGILDAVASTLGETSTIVTVNGNMGAPDGGRDLLAWRFDDILGATYGWSGVATGLLVRMAITGIPAVGTRRGLYVGINEATDFAAAGTDGLFGGWIWTTAAANVRVTADDYGAPIALGGNLSQMLPVVSTLWFPFAQTAPESVTSVIIGGTARESIDQTPTNAPWTDAVVWVGVESDGAAAYTFAGVQVDVSVVAIL
jgi:hypothetical protein